MFDMILNGFSLLLLQYRFRILEKFKFKDPCFNLCLSIAHLSHGDSKLVFLKARRIA